MVSRVRFDLPDKVRETIAATVDTTEFAVATLIEAGWRPHQRGEVWRCENDHWETIGNPCICNGGTQNLKWGESSMAAGHATRDGGDR